MDTFQSKFCYKINDKIQYILNIFNQVLYIHYNTLYTFGHCIRYIASKQLIPLAKIVVVP